MPKNSRDNKRAKNASDHFDIKISGEYPYEERDKHNRHVRPGSARTRGFRGNTFGAASPVRQWTKEEIAAYERKLASEAIFKINER